MAYPAKFTAEERKERARLHVRVVRAARTPEQWARDCELKRMRRAEKLLNPECQKREKQLQAIRDQRRMEKRGEERRQYARDYYHAGYCKIVSKRQIDNPEMFRERRKKRVPMVRIWRAEKQKTDPQFRLSRTLRSRINMLLIGRVKSAKTFKLIGCDLDWLIAWIEVHFQSGMTWQNYGRDGWHVDHIRPCASFDLIDSDQQKRCFHWTNLQPLWARDNLSKHAKWEPITA
jgi:hypothetical protein